MSSQPGVADTHIADPRGAGAPLSVLRRFGRLARNYLPRGDSLPAAAWRTRHRAMLGLLWMHVGVVPIVGVVNGNGLLHSLLEGSLVTLAAVAASVSGKRTFRAVAATLGLVTSSALLVHFSGGLIEFHFHFFVVVALITLYQSWLPFLVALAYVVLHHGVMGAIDPLSVYNHPAAIANPWKWALVHGFFILGESAALLVAWRLNEAARAEAESSYENSLRHRQASEAALKEREAQFRILFENNPLPMWVYDLDSLRFLAVNLAAVLHYGFTKDEFLKMKIADIRPQEDVPAVLEDIGAKRDPLQHSGPWRHVTKNGDLREVEIKSHTLDFVGKAAALVVVDDVTERRQAEKQRTKLESQLRQAQKMEAVGQLAGGIAHDFNNILSVVTNYASFLMDEMEPDDPRRQDAEEIRAAGDRGARLVQQILAFSRKEIVDPELLDLNGCISEMENMLTRTLGEDIALDLHLEPGTNLVNIDRSQIEQVLVNLAINARDAMKQGGSLAIGTSNVHFDESVVGQHPEMSSGDYVSLTVSDLGEGMTDEVKARIFEPFFTTKPTGEGTGLGLAMVYGVVRRAGGFVYVYSEPKIGTTFRIYLPAAARATTTESNMKDPEPTPKGRGTVLLVEDEPAVRELTRRILEGGGFNVVAAKGGDEALAIWGTIAGTVDLLLTDVIMPGMSGKELDENLRSSGNGFRTVYMSGYTDEIIAERGMLHAGEELIQKPFNAQSLLSKVKEMLDR